MIRVALLMSALLALAGAHIYERCELARELASLGVHRDHLATWVCIAYHESRFDTAARNHGSGDHGLFQISELYWCGPGKACRAPCTAFRDEDISDDLECALKIHEEHTRLQGDGYLAWVVYPQHCKHINAKKYLVDCEASIKNVTIKLDSRSRSLKSNNVYTTPKPFDANYYANNLPSFLAINSIFEGNQAKQLEGDGQKIDWLNFKIDNIDNIKLPMISNDALFKFITPPTTTTTVNNFEEDLRNSYKNDWINYKIENIDTLKLPTFYGNAEKSGLPNWININIDSRIDDLTLPVSINNAVIKHVTPSSTQTTYINYEENYLKKSYKNDWINFKINNIDDIKLPALNKNAINQRNNHNSGQLNWLNIKIDSKIDDLDLPTFNKLVNMENTTPATISTTTTTTTIDPDLIGIKPPMPRRIESNQFRRKMLLINAMIAIQDVNKHKELPDNTLVQPGLIVNNMPYITTTKTQPQTTTTFKPVTSVSPHYVPNNNTWVTSRPLTTKSVFNFQWKSTLRPNFSTKAATTPKTVLSQEMTPNTGLSQNVNSVPETNQLLNKFNSDLTTKSAYNVNKLLNNKDESVDVINMKADTVVTTTLLPSYFNKYSQERSTISTTTAKPTTNSWNKNNNSPTTSKSEITTASSIGSTSFDWNKRFQERFTFKPFTSSTQKSTTSTPYWPYISPKLTQFTTNTSKILPFEGRLNSSKPTFPPASSTTAKPYLNVLNTSKTSQTDLSNKTSSTISTRYTSFFSTTVAQSNSTTVRPATNRHRWSFSSFASNLNRSFGPPLNMSQSVVPQTVVTSTARPFWTYKTTAKPELLNISSEPRKYSTFQSFTIKPVQELSTSVKSIEYNPSSSVKPQIESKPSEKSPDQPTTKSTPSIFDLYLRPEKFYSDQKFQFPSFKSSANKLTVFSGGTTPLPDNVVSVKP